MWVSSEDDKACHDLPPPVLRKITSFHRPWEEDIPSFASALIQLPNTCRHKITVAVPRYHILPHHSTTSHQEKKNNWTGMHQRFVNLLFCLYFNVFGSVCTIKTKLFIEQFCTSTV